MFKKTKIVFASEELISVISEDLQLQLQVDYKVKMSNQTSGGVELQISKRDFLALVGGKESKTVYLSPAPNGNIICETFGPGLGALIVPAIIIIVSFATGFLSLISLLVLGITIFGIVRNNKLSQAILNLVQESATRNTKDLENKPEDASSVCPNCKTVNEGSGFCAECGTKLK